MVFRVVTGLRSFVGSALFLLRPTKSMPLSASWSHPQALEGRVRKITSHPGLSWLSPDRSGLCSELLGNSTPRLCAARGGGTMLSTPGHLLWTCAQCTALEDRGGFPLGRPGVFLPITKDSGSFPPARRHHLAASSVALQDWGLGTCT